MSTHRLLNDDDERRRRQRRRQEATNGAAWFLGLLALAFLAWAIATTVIAANRVDPPGTFQCGAATGQDGDLCFDVIIVGGGTAGLAVAREISADPTKRVAVIEAGPDYINDPEVNDVGDLFKYLSLMDRFPYKYHFLSQGKQESGADDRVMLFDGGRMLGGSSYVNYLLQYRGTQEWWDTVDVAVGSPGTFTGAAMYQTFQDIEYLDDNGHYTNLATRGNGQTTGQTWKLDAQPTADATGYDPSTLANFFGDVFTVPIYNTESVNGEGITVGSFPYAELLYDFNTSSPLLRWSSRKAFLDSSVMNQVTYTGVFPRQLSVLLNSTVTKLLTQGTRVTGVKFMGPDGNMHQAFAKDTVILCANHKSAQIMQRSGIGPAAVLANANVPAVLVNENVGQNMLVQTAAQFPVFWSNVTGVNPDGGTRPNLALFAAPDYSSLSPGPTTKVFNNGMFVVNGLPSIVSVFVSPQFPYSTGSIEISSPDPNMDAILLSGMLTDTRDMTVWRENIRFYYNSLTAADPGFVFLTIDNTTVADDTLLDAWIRTNVFTQFHYFASNKMGTSATASVVDNHFRVWGTDGSLRVCDTSSFPLAPDGNPSYTAAGFATVCGRLFLEENISTSKRAAHRDNKRTTKRFTKTDSLSQRKAVVAKAAPSQQELCTAINNYIAYIRAHAGAEQADRLITAIKLGDAYISNNCAAA